MTNFFTRNRKAVLKSILASVGVLAIMTGLTGGGYYYGFQTGQKQTKHIEITGVNNITPPSGVEADFEPFWQAWSVLKSEYIDGAKINNQDMVYGAINGMVNSLGDPYTVYFKPSDAQSFSQDLNGNFGGVGIEIDLQANQLVIIAPLKGTPAESAGLLAKDKIEAIDGKSTSGKTLDEAVNLMRGQVGTPVTLSILRDGWSKPKNFKIIRQTIEVPTVDWKMINGNIIYLQLYSFNQNTDAAFSQAVTAGLSQGGKAMILDLRNNPGGYLNVAVDTAGWFLKDGSTVVEEVNAQNQKTTLTAQGSQTLLNMPVVVLINGGSASAAEILAGALHDDRGIQLVGTQSFGKGSVQELVTLGDGSTLKVTIAKWLLPNGEWINKVGLTPSIKIADPAVGAKNDPPLDKATKMIKADLESSAASSATTTQPFPSGSTINL